MAGMDAAHRRLPSIFENAFQPPCDFSSKDAATQVLGHGRVHLVVQNGPPVLPGWSALRLARLAVPKACLAACLARRHVKLEVARARTARPGPC